MLRISVDCAIEAHKEECPQPLISRVGIQLCGAGPKTPNPGLNRTSACAVKGAEPQWVQIPPTAPRCVQTARHGRTVSDLRRTGNVSGWHWDKWTYKRKRNGERCVVSSRTAEWYQKHGESHVTGRPATESGRGRQPAKAVGKREEGSE